MKNLWKKLKLKLKESDSYTMEKVSQRVNITFVQFFKIDDYIAKFRDQIVNLNQNRLSDSLFMEYSDLSVPSHTSEAIFELVLRFQINILETGEKIE
jgi:hypothetical protein